MTNAIHDLASTLKTAREAKGFSQRALSKRAGLTQAQISKVENAADVKLSSLVELARALDLEVALIPRKTVSAVQSIVRSAAAEAPDGQAAKTFRDLQEAANELLKRAPDSPDAQRLQRIVGEIRRLRLWPSDLEALQQALRDLRRAAKSFDTAPSARTAYEVLDLRQRLQEIADNRPQRHDADDRAKPAYSLDDGDGDE